ncbi:SRPBCC family protein [Acaryochloris sp. CCMEE 5410]|uniref:SRPBCC family protein n=1 Tax=Acaryochloris sp. CCMEE 5410 TaxID=310037 RepID=UPI0002484203|nr:SRPBCC family protein [Acaryochloris sp. CCMEE 5410]KAI9130300.1 SRPBCC family protein [Acaryochloris sp. CCMEE 5410]
MAIFRNAISGLIGLLLLVVIGGLILPSDVHVERNILINASPAEIFPVVSDLSKWSTWSPWAKMDPNMALTVEGDGVGQTMHWQSEDPMVGTGTQEITAMGESSYIQTHLDFGQQGTADAALQLTPQDNGTLVDWSLDTDVSAGVPPIMKPVSSYLRFVLESAVGQDYEAGLSNLKALIEQ